MGLYLERLSDGTHLASIYKARQLVKDGAKQIPPPARLLRSLVCVVENGPFDGAAWCFNEAELRAFSDPSDRRPRIWLVATDEQMQRNFLSSTLDNFGWDSQR